MQTHGAKVMTKARFHEGTRLRVESLAGRVQHVVHDRGHTVRVLNFEFRVLSCALERLPILVALSALAAGDGASAASAFAFQDAVSRWRQNRRWSIFQFSFGFVVTWPIPCSFTITQI